MTNPVVTTKAGDRGMTELYNGKKILKSSLIIELIGSCDESQAVLAVLKTHLPNPIKKTITAIQGNLYLAMGEFSGASVVKDLEIESWVTDLEKEQDALLKKATIPHRFVIPGRSISEAWCHFARTVVRRFERRLVEATAKTPRYKKYLPFANRLSDFLFVLGAEGVQ